MNPIRRRPCADPGQKQVPGEWITQKGIDSSRPVTEAACAKVESTRVSHHEFTGSPGIPARDGFNGLFRALPGDRALLSPSPADNSADLTPTIEASGPHDFTVRFSAVRQPAVSSLTGNRPAITCAPDADASTAPRPACRGDHDTPLWWDGMAGNIGAVLVL
jgi:hypothetical protein